MGICGEVNERKRKEEVERNHFLFKTSSKKKVAAATFNPPRFFLVVLSLFIVLSRFTSWRPLTIGSISMRSWSICRYCSKGREGEGEMIDANETEEQSIADNSDRAPRFLHLPTLFRSLQAQRRSDYIRLLSRASEREEQT